MTGNKNNSRIAKNTILLYARQLLIMLVSLYTSRVVLHVLGVTDYGIYNVVSGVVTMLSFVTGTMASATQRYLAYDLASGDAVKLKETFGLIMLTYIMLAIITVLLMESVAVWFLNKKMTIPAERLYEANWVLQFAALTFIVHVFAAPYLSAIIAHEQMGAYAYVSIAEVVLKLLMVLLLQTIPYDRLILYSILMFVSSLIITLCYKFYCNRNFPESRFKFYFNLKRFKEMTAFAWWNMIGSLANVLRSQGINVLLNLFFNPTVNAARGIAYQVNSAITSFSSNFYTAVKPQIIKSYASGENTRMRQLIVSSSKLAFFLLLFISMPIELNSQFVMNLWLVEPPEYASLFVRIILLNALVEVFSLPLTSGLQATGNIKYLQLSVSIIYLLNIPISYVFLKLGFAPETPMIVNLVLVVIALVPRLLLCNRYYNLSIKRYFFDVLVRVWAVALACYVIGRYLYGDSTDTLLGFALRTVVLWIIIVVFALLFGLSSRERKMAVGLIKSIKDRIS